MSVILYCILARMHYLQRTRNVSDSSQQTSYNGGIGIVLQIVTLRNTTPAIPTVRVTESPVDMVVFVLVSTHL